MWRKKLLNVLKRKIQRFIMSSKQRGSQQRMTRKMCINCQCGIMVFLNLNCPSSIHSSPSFILHFPFSIINFPSSYIKSSLTILNSSSSTLLPPPSVKFMGYLTKNDLKIGRFWTKCPQVPHAVLCSFFKVSVKCLFYLM